MKVILTSNQPLAREKLDDLLTRLEAFLGLARSDVLVLPAGVSLHLVSQDSSPAPACRGPIEVPSL